MFRKIHSVDELRKTIDEIEKHQKTLEARQAYAESTFSSDPWAHSHGGRGRGLHKPEGDDL